MTRSALVTLLLALALAPSARADGVGVGGSVDSTLSLALSSAGGLGWFPARARTHTYSATVHVTVTATDPGTTLSVADGDATAAPRRGRLVDGTATLPTALTASTTAAPGLSLDAPIDPLLQTWTQPIASRTVMITLRQTLAAGAARRGPYRKTILVTLSASAP